MKLGSGFFAKDTLWVARNLLGKQLCRWLHTGEVIRSKITETEAYKGFDDKASHASKGRTKRTEVMFGEPGTIYVYLVYGLHHCLNIVTEKNGYPAAVLIRSVKDASGPGRVCRFFKIDKKLNGQRLGREIWIEEEISLASPRRSRGRANLNPDAPTSSSGVGAPTRRSRRIQVSRRVGVGYAGECADWPWRFIF